MGSRSRPLHSSVFNIPVNVSVPLCVFSSRIPLLPSFLFFNQFPFICQTFPLHSVMKIILSFNSSNVSSSDSYTYLEPLSPHCLPATSRLSQVAWLLIDMFLSLQIPFSVSFMSSDFFYCILELIMTLDIGGLRSLLLAVDFCSGTWSLVHRLSWTCTAWFYTLLGGDLFRHLQVSRCVARCVPSRTEADGLSCPWQAVLENCKWHRPPTKGSVFVLRLPCSGGPQQVLSAGRWAPASLCARSEAWHGGGGEGAQMAVPPHGGDPGMGNSQCLPNKWTQTVSVPGWGCLDLADLCVHLWALFWKTLINLFQIL